jgi:CYTH domain-containing protein
MENIAARPRGRLAGVARAVRPLRGLILAEVEFESAADEAAFQRPGDVLAEVTADPRFAGGHLATLSADDTKDLLGAFGIGA